MESRVSLGELADLVTKGTTPTTLKKNFVSNGIPFLRINNLDNGVIDYSNILYIDDETNQLLSRSVVKPGDFLITIAGTIGKTVIVPNDAPLMNCNQAVAIIRVTNDLDKSYLKYWLSTSDALAQIAGAKVTATISNLSLGQIKNLKIPLPPLKEQKRIAAILDKADAIRRKRQQAIDLTDQLIRSVFLEMFGDPSEYLERYNVFELDELSPKITDGEHGTVKRLESGMLYLMARNITKDYKIDLSKVSYISEDDHRRINTRCNAEKNDLLLVCVGATIGKIALVPDMEEFSLARSVALIKVNPDLINPKFMLHIFKTQYIQNQILNRRNTSAQAGLYTGQIKKIKMPCPDISEQNKFVEIVEKLETVSTSFTKHLNESINLFNSLSQRSFCGELAKQTEAA